MKFRTLTLTLLIAVLSLQSCKKDAEVTPANKNDDVFELVIRKLNPGITIQEFETARDAFVLELMKEEGTSNDREFQPFFDFSNSLATDSIYIGMTQYEDLSTYESIGQSLGSAQVAANFFSKFTPLSFDALQPLEEYKPLDLGELATLQSNRVLEIAVRDLSTYASFNESDYISKRDAFLTALAQQTGFVQEVQWESVTNGNIVVGMTVYQNQQAAVAILSDTSFTNSTAVIDFLSTYPPNKVATINTILK